MEAVHSRRLLYLLESRKQLVDKYTVVDVNTELKKALSVTNLGESTKLLRESLIS